MYDTDKRMKEDSGELQRGTYPCTVCPSSDALRVYRKVDKLTGRDYYDATCFSCRHKENEPPGFPSKSSLMQDSYGTGFNSHRIPLSTGRNMSPLVPSATNKTPEQIIEHFLLYPIRAFPERKISKEAAERYGVRSSISPMDGETILTRMYPRYKKKKLTGYKERIVADKKFFLHGDCQNNSLFGAQVVPANGKTLFITEGEEDCLALYDILRLLSNLPNWEPSVVSLTNGAASAVRDISMDMEFVDSFEKIVLVLDQDEAGQAAVDDACKLLAGKVYIASYTEKDPNAMLLAGKAEEMKWEVLKHAKMYMPDSIINYADAWDRYKAGKNQECYPFPSDWTELNQKTYGIRLGEVVMLSSGSGSGKSQFLRELKYHYYETTEFKIADIALEEDVGDSMAGMVALHVNRRITLPDVFIEEDAEKQAFDYLFASRRWSGYDYFGGLDNDNLFSKIRFFAATGHKLIFLDHLSIIVSEYAADGGERERIDTIMTKLAKMVKELNITIFLIVHLKKTTSGTSFEEGATPSLDDLRGSGTLKQLSWTVLGLSRNQQHDDKVCANTSKITVLKCRFTGRTGTADYLHFNDVTGRMHKVEKPHNYEHNDKGNGRLSLNTSGANSYGF